jgi:hypothetical protein
MSMKISMKTFKIQKYRLLDEEMPFHWVTQKMATFEQK